MHMHAEAAFSSQSPGGETVPLATMRAFQINPSGSPLSCCFTGWAALRAQVVVWEHEVYALLLTNLSWYMETGGFFCSNLPGSSGSILDLGVREICWPSLPASLMHDFGQIMELLWASISSSVKWEWFPRAFPSLRLHDSVKYCHLKIQHGGSRGDSGLGVWRLRFCLFWCHFLTLSSWANSFMRHSLLHTSIASELNTNNMP